MQRLDDATTDAEAGARHTVAGGQPGAPDAGAAAVEAEGEVAREPATTADAVVAWLFRSDEEPREVGLDEIAELAADDDNFLWIDLDGYGEADLREVEARLDLPAFAVRSALAGWQRPRLDVFGDRYFVAVTVPWVEPEARRVLAGELDLFVGRNYLVSAHKRPLPFAERALARARQDPALLKLDSAFMLSILLDELLAHYEGLAEGLEDEIEEMEERALVDDADAFLTDLLRLKRYVFAVYRLADQHPAVFAAFLRPDFPLVGGERVEPYFRDLEERLARLRGALAAAKESVNGAFDIYVSQVSHRTNNFMKILTMVSTVVLPASIVFGFFGADFESPQLDTGLAFVVMVAVTVLLTAATLFMFYRWGWLTPSGRPPGAGRARAAWDDDARNDDGRARP